MSGLAGSVYVWDPNYGGINHSSNYIVNTGSESNGSLYIEPFQAFFMYTTGGTGNSNGFVKSKKYRVTTPSVATVTNKTNSSSEISFNFYVDSVSNPLKIYLHPSQFGSAIEKDEYRDAVFSGSEDAWFFVISDSSRYMIKHVPKTFSSLTIPLTAHTKMSNKTHQIGCSDQIDDSYVYFIKDLKSGAVHNLSSPYFFTNDPSFLGNRFELTLIPNTVFGSTELQKTKSWISSSDVPHYHSDQDAIIEYYFNVNGQLVSDKQVVNGAALDYLITQPTGAYFFKLSNGEVIKFLKK